MLELKHISVEFQSQRSVLAVEDVSLTLPEGSRTAIIGETGSGKSVLLLAIIGLLPANARVSGQILLNGENLLDIDQKMLQKVRGGMISYVPQGGGASMNPLLKVGFQVGEPLMEHRGYTKKQAMQASIGLLRRFHLTEEERLAASYPHTFSGGMRQRAMVAMGIAANAQIILADEPTKGLDEERIQLVAQSFNLLEQETLLCVTHDMNFARKISGQICVMYAAQQVEWGKAEQIFHRPLHPYTQDMLAAMPELGMTYQTVGFAPPHGDDLQGCRYKSRCRDRHQQCDAPPPLTNIDGHQVRCWNYVAANS